MKGWILPRVTAANTNLPEVLMAAVMLERTVRAFIMCPHLIASNFQRGGGISPKISSGIKAVTHTHTHTDLLVSLWSDAAADEESKHSHSLKRTHGHAHASCSTAPKLLRGFQTACHVKSHPHSYFQMPTDGGKGLFISL